MPKFLKLFFKKNRGVTVGIRARVTYLVIINTSE